ncbi:hypothetical protein CRUP_022170 [Coryphaenoides rupestris]|nr:hypothetical protein CRUP_022170 [Coryphaenoides rupestris]
MPALLSPPRPLRTDQSAAGYHRFGSVPPTVRPDRGVPSSSDTRAKRSGMSLYDDLGVAANDSKTEGWSKNFKLLQSQLKVKKAALTQAKTQRMKQTTVLAPVIDLKRGGPVDDRQISDTPPLHIAASLKDPAPGGFSPGDVLVPLADEYDPMFPNDYEKVLKRHRDERQRQREQERQKEIEEREKKRKDRHEVGAPSGFSRFPAAEGESEDEDEYETERRKRAMGGAAIAPPSSLVDRDGSAASSFYEDEGRPPRGKAAIPPPVYEDSERSGRTATRSALRADSLASRPQRASRRTRTSSAASSFYEDEGRPPRGKAAIPPPVYEDSERPRSPPGPTNTFLANMGTALSVEKTSKRGGKIIIGDAAEKQQRGPVRPRRRPRRELLQNMVGRGEVDEDLEGETKEECEKYGKVTKCVIFEFRVLNLGEQV